MEKGNSSAVARGRLAVLSAHLAASVNLSDSKLLETSVVSATSVVAPPPNLKGALTIIDERTGKRYPVQVSEEGTIKATDLKKVFIKSNSEFLFNFDLFTFYNFVTTFAIVEISVLFFFKI